MTKDQGIVPIVSMTNTLGRVQRLDLGRVPIILMTKDLVCIVFFPLSSDVLVSFHGTWLYVNQ